MPVVESKQAANYTTNGSPAEHCGICRYYSAGGTREEGTCAIVSGDIMYQGWCRHWLHAHAPA